MNRQEVAGVFVRVEGQKPKEPKLVIWYRLDRFRDLYDVRRLSRRWGKIDMVRDLLALLDGEFPAFLERVAEMDESHRRKNSHRRRRYISKNQSELYPGHDQAFAKRYSEPYKEYWIATNIGSHEIRQLICEMCEACKITFGSIPQLEL
jgi:hypothetical protein